MRFNVAERFRLARSVAADLPWAEGVVFRIRYIGNADYSKWLEEHREDSAVTAKIRELGIKAASIAHAKAGQRRGRERDRFVKEQSQLELARLIESADLDVGDIETSDEGVVRHLVDDVDGLQDLETGEELAWSPEVGLALLAESDPIPDDVTLGDEDDPLELEAGTPIGRAIKAWILWVSSQAQRFREEQLEGAAKN